MAVSAAIRPFFMGGIKALDEAYRMWRGLPLLGVAGWERQLALLPVCPASLV
jgi:hypothetical protein